MQLFGVRHVGGGPAEYGRDGQELADLATWLTGDPETHIVDPETGELIPWDWKTSGTVEMNCFLCHTPEPNNEARKEALHDGDFEWVGTATLLGTGVVEHMKTASGFGIRQNLTKVANSQKRWFLFRTRPTKTVPSVMVWPMSIPKHRWL